MTEIDTYIQTIAKKHGVVLHENDPILCLHTFFGLYAKDLSLLQSQMLQDMASASEDSFARWNAEVTAKANRIISLSLEAAKNTTAAQFDEQSAALKKSIAALLEADKQEALNLYKRTYHLAVANMIASALLAFAALFIFLK